MRQIIVMLLAMTAIVAASPAAKSAIGYEPRGPHPLEGAWRLVGHLAEEDDVIEPAPAALQHIKLVTDRCFAWTTAENGRIVGSAGGQARFGRSTYVERVDYVGDDALAWMIGRRLTFRWTIRDGLWYHIGSLEGEGGRVFRVAEVWERIR